MDNPKDAIGRTKVPMGLFPDVAIAYGAVAMYEGALKYGLANFRATPVRASVYTDALRRHLAAWHSGEEKTAEGGSHLGHVLACAAIILDARMHGTLIDDRPIAPHPDAWTETMKELQDSVRRTQEDFGEVNPKHYTREG